MFAYCGNNPVLSDDQNGKCGLLLASLALGLLGAAIDYGMQVLSNYHEGYTGKTAWVDNVSFGSVASSAFSSAISLSPYGVVSSLASFVLSPAIELSVDHALSPSKENKLTLENYATKQGERFVDVCMTQKMSNDIWKPTQGTLTNNVVRSAVSEMGKSSIIETVCSTARNYILSFFN